MVYDGLLAGIAVADAYLFGELPTELGNLLNLRKLNIEVVSVSVEVPHKESSSQPIPVS